MACNEWLHLKAAAARAKYKEETLREHCRNGWVHAHRVGRHGVWVVEVTAEGFVADAPVRCDCVTPKLGSAVPQEPEEGADDDSSEG